MKVIDRPRKARKAATRTPMPFLHRTSGGGRPARGFHTLHEMAVAARLNLTAAKWDTLCGGSDSEMTLRRNRYAPDCLALRQRVLVDVSVIETAASWQTMNAPGGSGSPKLSASRLLWCLP